MLVKTKDGKVKDVQLKDVTAENYIVEEREQKLYHCLIEVRRFDASTGKRLSVPRIQKFEPRAFESFQRRELELQGYTIEVLHNPKEWAKKQAEEAKKAEAKKAEAKEE